MEKRCKSGSQRVQKYVKVIAKEYNIIGGINIRGVTSGNQQRGGQMFFFKLHSYVCCSATTHVNQQANNLKEIYGKVYSSEE